MCHGRIRYPGRLAAWTVAAGLAGMLVGTPAVALADSPNVMRVEEDWELVLAAPLTIKTAPQLETIISTSGDLSSIFARTTWNHLWFQPGDALARHGGPSL